MPTGVRCSAATRIRRRVRSASRSRPSARCRSGTMVRRSGAKVGDHVFVSGTIGDAALGPAACARAEAQAVEARCRDERASRLALSRAAAAHRARRGAARARERRDGCLGRARRRSRESSARASNVSADIEVARVPLSRCRVSSARRSTATLIEPILTGGEDYEILCAIAPDRVAAFQRAAAKAGVPVTEIGRIVAGRPRRRAFLDPDRQPR